MKHTIQYVIGVIAFCILVLAGGQSVEAASTKNVTGTCKYDEAYEVLELLNKKRSAQGLDELEMDKELLAAAMMRAAEMKISFSHYRPNGTICFSASDKMYAENIAYGYRTAASVMNSWYNSAGHRINMMNSEYQSVGIGCFYSGGVRYWVQCFGYDEAVKISEPSNIKRTYKVSLTSGVETKIVSSNPLSTRVENFKATAGTKKLTLKWKKKSGISGYQIQISTGKTFKNKQTYTVGKGKTKKVITKYNGKKLQSNKKYYVRIRAYKKTTNSDGTVTTKYSKWKTINKKTKG